MGKGEVMERNKTNLNMDKVEDMRVRAQTISGQDGGLALKLWNAAYHGSGLRYEEVDIEARKQFLKHLQFLYQEQGVKPQTIEEFWILPLRQAVVCLVGEQGLADLQEMSSLYQQTAFSEQDWKSLYHVTDITEHVSSLIWKVCEWIDVAFYNQSLTELLCTPLHQKIPGYVWHLALQLKRNNAEILALVQEAMFGDNQTIYLTQNILTAIAISGNPQLLEQMMQLLRSAGGQEGLRKRILLAVSNAETPILKEFLQICLEEDLFRFDSAVQAFQAWTGLRLEKVGLKKIRYYAEVAWQCLSDDGERKQYLQSKQTQEVYLAIWAAAYYNLSMAKEEIERLLADTDRARRLLGWAFLSNYHKTYLEKGLWQMNLARQYLTEQDDEILAWAVNNLAVTSGARNGVHFAEEYRKLDWRNEALPTDKEERLVLFTELETLLQRIGSKPQKFTGRPFALSEVVLSREPVFACMTSLMLYDQDDTLLERLVMLLPKTSVEQRQTFYENFVRPEYGEAHKRYLLQALQDRSQQVKEVALKKLANCSMTVQDLLLLADMLCAKSSSLRQAVINLLAQQNPESLLPVLEQLLTKNHSYQIQAGLELLLLIKEKAPQLLEAQQAKIEFLKNEKGTAQMATLLQQLLHDTELEKNAHKEPLYTKENGFGLYQDPAIRLPRKQLIPDSYTKRYTEEELQQWLCFDETALNKIQTCFNAVFQRHAGYEYRGISHFADKAMMLRFGEELMDLPVLAEAKNCRWKVERVPFYKELWQALEPYTQDLLHFLPFYYTLELRENPKQVYCADPILEKMYIKKANHKEGSIYDRGQEVKLLLFARLVFETFATEEIFSLALTVYRSLVALIGESKIRQKQLLEHPVFSFWLQLLRQTGTEETALLWFEEERRLEGPCNEEDYWWKLGLDDYLRAYDAGLIDQNELYAYLLFTPDAASGLNVLTRALSGQLYRGDKCTQYSWLSGVVQPLVDRILEIELQRGDLDTPVTHLARGIASVKGIDCFVKLLVALGDELFQKESEYSSTKTGVLRQLLKKSYPDETDTVKDLQQLLRKAGLKDNVLVQTALYVPQWAGLLEQAMDWPGLEAAVWFFRAHMREIYDGLDDREKDENFARYTPFSLEQLRNGVFDRDWLQAVYKELGEKRFQKLYKGVKYIVYGGNGHRRVQLFVDAALGKLGIEELQKEIVVKRNQDKLRAYALIPIKDGDRAEALRRYEFIRQFAKESKQFGAQRRQSEDKACQAALQNLARTANFSDVDHMVWCLESEKIKQIETYLQPLQLENVWVWLEIDNNGIAQIAVEKSGKRQKTVPKTLQKENYIVELKTVIKDLREQQRRAKESLEQAMVRGCAFPVWELKKLSANPVLAPLLYTLVWTDGRQFGFLNSKETCLGLLDNQEGYHELFDDETVLMLAHPYHLMQAGVWQQYMHIVYVQQIVQPFKQIFREYYPLTVEETHEKHSSRRYAGFQIDGPRATALLRQRGWVKHGRYGLSKVFYKENLLVELESERDWFTPIVEEEVVLDTVSFRNRKTWMPMELEAIPAILFSEVMRDIDLIVSVAYIGNHAPEASQAAVQIRRVLVAEVKDLLQLKNIELDRYYAKVQGNLANYSVHLGSGIVHVEGRGMLVLVPATASRRKKIFLPFADEDPKTAEILSKIILLADDTAIKDSGILQQIKQ